MAIVKLSPKHVKRKGSWGFLISDTHGNKYPMEYSRPQLKIPDNIAKDFEGDPNLIVEYDTDVKPVDKPTPVAKPEPPKKTKVERYKELKDLNASEQISMLKKLGAKKIPHYEDDKIKLIMELEG